jgi:rSAM/selenodomain-associated transferase 1
LTTTRDKKDLDRRDCLLLFTRYPEPGRVKTRLIAVLGRQGAAELHARMTGIVLNCLQTVAASRNTGLHVCYSGGSHLRMTDWLGAHHVYHRQKGSDLGKRMAGALSEAAGLGYERLLLLGSDCPSITPTIIEQSLTALDDHDLVLGPAYDGGYYLIGLCADLPPGPLLTAIDWGTKKVLRQTLERAEEIGLSRFLLPRLHDIDRPEDLVHLDHHPGS